MQPDKHKLDLFDEFTLDLARGCLSRGGQMVHLRPLTYEVLKYLVENRGQLLSKDKLIAEVWQGRAVTDGALGKCIEELREALGTESRQYLRNVRGRGYILDLQPENVETHLVQTEQVEVVSVIVSEECDGITDSDERAQLNRFGLNLTNLTKQFADERTPERKLIATTAVKWKYKKQIVLACLGLLLVGAAVFAYFKYRTSPTKTINSIAVLPFENATGDSDKEYLSDGIGDSIIYNLSRLPALRVMSRNSVFRYKGRQVDLRTTAAELGVQAVLTGQLVQRGDELSIRVELVNASDNTQIWGEQYNRKLADIVSLESEIARDITRKLQARLSSAEERLLTRTSTRSAEAYELFLKGRYYSSKVTLEEIRKGIGFYQSAIDADPTYALAYAGLAEAYRSLAIAGWGVPSRDAYPQAKAAAMRAVEIDQNLPEARIALGWIAFSYDWDWNEAENEFKKVIAANPNNADAHRGYAHLCSILGRYDEAVAEGKRARELDPLALLTNALEGQFLFYAGRNDEAQARFEKTLELEPNFWIAHNGLGRVYINQGRYEEAIRELRKAISITSVNTEPITQLGYALAKSGRPEEARETLANLASLSPRLYVPAYSFAIIHQGLGEKEEALKYLEKSLAEREVQITFLKIDHRWDDMRSDARFLSLIERIGFTS